MVARGGGCETSARSGGATEWIGLIAQPAAHGQRERARQATDDDSKANPDRQLRKKAREDVVRRDIVDCLPTVQRRSEHCNSEHCNNDRQSGGESVA